MELAADDGHTIHIPSGCKKTLGRGSELAVLDKSVSRYQVLVELKEQHKRVDADHDSSLFGLSIEVLGANPVCILHTRQSTKDGSVRQEVVFLKKGEKDTILVGEKISLSVSHPKFFTVKEGDGSKGNQCSMMNRHDSLAEDDLLAKWKDRKNRKESGTSISQTRVHSDASRIGCFSKDKDASMNEEVGIAEAVARRQKRALERHKQQAHKLQNEWDEEPIDMSHVGQEARELEEAGIAQAVARRQKRALERQQQQTYKVLDVWNKAEEDSFHEGQEGQELEDDPSSIQSLDPVKEFGFLVEGSEFDHYKRKLGKWIWPPATSVAKSSSSDDYTEGKFTPKRDRKVRAESDDEEWGGDDPEEVAAVASTKKRKLDCKSNLRSHKPSTSRKKERALRRGETSGGKMAKNQIEELDDGDESDETLGGFIVNDEEEGHLDASDDAEEEPLSEGDDADDEDESSKDEDIDEIEDEEQAIQNPPKESMKKKEEKPLCKYGKSCYRKNPDHLSQFRH